MIVISDNIYTEDSIESLDPREHIQLRSGMYIGSNENPNQLLMEIFSNALDEYNIGHGKNIYVSISKNGTCRVRDEAQGFPVSVIRPEDGKTILEASFGVINTSGKYRDDGVYEGSSLGLNGVGGKVSNFLSTYFSVCSHRDGKYENLLFKEGLLENREVGEWKDSTSGTDIEYLPDPKYFQSNITDAKYFEKFFEDICCMCPGLTIKLTTDNSDKIIKKNGINDLVTSRIGGNVEIINNRFILENKNISLGMTFTSSNNSTILSYVNLGETDSGPHITSLKSSITRILNSWAKENGLLKEKEKNLDGSSIQEGMLLVCNISSTGVTYDSQTKSRVVSLDSNFIDEFNKQFEVWLDNNPEDGKIIIEKALLARKASEAAKKAREAVKNKADKKDKVFKLPTTLADCWSKDRSECELFLTEGKSAMSGLVAGRDSKFQAVYGVRGKMLSVLKTKQENIMKNQEINNIIQALGLDYDIKTGKCKYDKKKLRYDKIIAAADADFDGFAIENLMFNIFWYICPDLIIEGHVYSSVPPLYRVTTKKNEYIYLRDDNALNEYKKKNPNSIQFIGRMKGLGEQDSDELAYCLLEPGTRNLYQLTVSDIGKTNKMFQDLYGKNVEPRVKFLEKHLEEARVE